MSQQSSTRSQWGVLQSPGWMQGNNVFLSQLTQLCNELCYGCVPQIKGIHYCPMLSSGYYRTVITGFGMSSLPTRSRGMLKNQREPIRQLLKWSKAWSRWTVRSWGTELIWSWGWGMFYLQTATIWNTEKKTLEPNSQSPLSLAVT